MPVFWCGMVLIQMKNFPRTGKSGSWKPGAVSGKMPTECHWEALWDRERKESRVDVLSFQHPGRPWAGHLISPRVSFVICKIRSGLKMFQ